MKDKWYLWLEFSDKTYLPKDHPKFQEYNEKYLKTGKETMNWKYVGAIYPPEHYGLKLLDIH